MVYFACKKMNEQLSRLMLHRESGLFAPTKGPCPCQGLITYSTKSQQNGLILHCCFNIFDFDPTDNLQSAVWIDTLFRDFAMSYSPKVRNRVVAFSKTFLMDSLALDLKISPSEISTTNTSQTQLSLIPVRIGGRLML